MTEKDFFQQDSMHITKINLKPRGTNRTLHWLDRQTCLFTNDERRHLSLTTIGLFFPLSPVYEMEASEHTDHRLGTSEARQSHNFLQNCNPPDPSQ